MSDEPATDTLEPPPDDLADEPARDGHVDHTVDDGGYRRMVGGGPSAAFFDLDRTLIAGSSAFIMGRTARSAGLVPTRQFVRDAGSAIVFKLRGGSDKKTDGVRDRMLGAVKGMRQDDLIALNAEVLPKLLAKIRPEARRLLDLHRRAGRSTYIVSAAPVEIVEPLALALGMTAGIGTRGEVADGVYNGRLAGPFCYGAGKVVAMEEIARWDGLDLAAVVWLLGLGQRPPDAACRRPPGRRQPRRQAGPPRPRLRLADRPLQPAHQVGDPPHGRRRRRLRHRCRQLRRRHPLRPAPVTGC